MSFFDRLYPWPPSLLPRWAAAATQAPRASTPATPVAHDPATSPTSESDRQALVERRSQALRTMFPLLFSLYARRSDLWQAVSMERYLSQATNLADLEQRIREVQRRRSFSWSE